jgi:predicted nucleotide-binding protein
MLEELDLGEATWQELQASVAEKSNRVFVVHGHDDGMRESVARVLTALGLSPLILHEQPDRGRTIIEKFYDYSDVGFAVVLLSTDDVGYTKGAGSDAAQPRARQNVILELGFFLGRLRRENVVTLHRGDVEIPSDFSGVLYIPYDSSGAWRYKLTEELSESGYNASKDAL